MKYDNASRIPHPLDVREPENSATNPHNCEDSETIREKLFSQCISTVWILNAQKGMLASELLGEMENYGIAET
jgi:hypothetical protein